MPSTESIKSIQDIQRLLGVTPDGAWGPISQAAFDRLIHGEPMLLGNEHQVKATSFADPGDVIAYRRAIDAGRSEEQALSEGDNGVGCWGDDMTADQPYCALPPEDMIEKWGSVEAAKHKPVAVYTNGRHIVCQLGDRMPHRAHIHNGAGIDLNPAACKALGLYAPVMIDAIWSWL
jgi:hypothetical protein